MSAICAYAAIATPHDLATQIGIHVIQQGGNAFDAVVAVSLAVGVVQPYYSGLGGGGTRIFHTATGEWRWIQARGTAPNQISTELVAQAQKPSPTKCRRYSACLVIVPGLLAGLWTLHSRYGRLPWQTVCQDAQDLAQVGFQADTMMARYTTRSKLCNVDDYPLALHPPVIAGRRICQTRLAATLLHIAEEPSALYQGTLAEQICAYVERAGSIDCRPDFDAYRVHDSQRR